MNAENEKQGKVVRSENCGVIFGALRELAIVSWSVRLCLNFGFARAIKAPNVASHH